MKKYSSIAAILIAGLFANAQESTPIKWSYTAKRLNRAEAVVSIKAILEKGWHIYSQYVADGGPFKTELLFTESPDYALKGKSIEPKPLKKFEEAFDMEVSYFENTVSFQQKVKLAKDNVVIKGSVSFMLCNNDQCLPPESVEFSVVLK